MRFLEKMNNLVKKILTTGDLTDDKQRYKEEKVYFGLNLLPIIPMHVKM